MKLLSLKGGIMLALLVFGYTEVWGENWQFYANSNFGECYYDAESLIHPSKDIVRVWTKVIFNEQSVIVTEMVIPLLMRSTSTEKLGVTHCLVLTEYNCMERRFRDVKMIYYYKEGGTFSLKDSDLGIWDHVRYEICQKHDIRFGIDDRSFENEDEAKIWIIRNQLARRNLPLAERARLVLILKPIIMEKAKEKQREHGGTAPGKSLSQKSDEVSTKKELAHLAGVSHDTIHKVEVIEKEATPVS